MELYNYKATVLKVIDGDTVKLKIDLGYCIEWISNCRLAGINAPEISTEEGVKAKAYLSSILLSNTELLINSRKLDKYGRPVVELYFNGISINKKLVADGYAVKYDA